MITVGSLFSGIGGIELGLQRVGMQIKWMVEYDPYCQKVLEKHWPDVRRYGDVRDITELEYVDLIAGGIPCQPISVAGARMGTDDERWLWPEFRRIIRMVRPEFVLMENVSGLLSINNGRLFGGILSDLASCGYDAEWDCIPAAAVGAPHRRDRVFIVAYSQGSGRERILRSNSGGFLSSYWEEVMQALDTHSSYFQRFDERMGKPAVFGVDDGIPFKLDRLGCLGNAVVPQVAEAIGKMIIVNRYPEMNQAASSQPSSIS